MKKFLISDLRFGPFFWTQFLGAFNDNLLKFAVTLAVTYNDSLRGDLSPGLLTNLIAAVFILPFFLFSATSGQLADKYDKTRIMRLAKLIEPPIVLLTAAGFVFNSVYLLVFALFLLGTQAAFFGPAKYAYLPEQIDNKQLVLANALVETATFVAILLGTVAAGALMSQDTNGSMVYIVCAFGLCMALAGVAISLKIPSTPARQPDLKINWNVFGETWSNVQFVQKQKAVWPALLGISWLWFVGATYLTQFPLLSKTILNASAGVATFLLFLFTLGLGLGAFACEHFSRQRLEMGMVPWGLLLMTTGGVCLHVLLMQQTTLAQVVDLNTFFAIGNNIILCGVFLLISMGVGLYSVPLYTSMQMLAPKESRSRVVSGNNIVNSLFMVGSAILAVALLVLTNGKVIWVFFAVTLANGIILIFWCKRQPYLVLRACLLWRVSGKLLPMVDQPDDLPDDVGRLIVFPSLLHDNYLLRMASLPMPFEVVLSGRLKSSWFVNWMRRHGFVCEFSKLTEEESQRQLVQKIATQIQKKKSIAIDKAMFELLKGQYRLDDLPGLLAKKNVSMQVVEFLDGYTQVKGRKRSLLKMNPARTSPY